MSDSTIWNNAYQLLQNSDVTARVEHLKTYIAEAGLFHFDRLCPETRKRRSCSFRYISAFDLYLLSIYAF